nr:GatB/YqeY domain-containing protein [Actinocorallia herbida]
MVMLKEQLESDLTSALKAHDDVRKRTLRMALAAVTNEEKAGKTERTLSDDEIVKVLAREVKKRKEAAEAFAGGGRAEQAQAERDEGAVLEAYLPQQLSDDELATLVREAIAESGAEGPRAMGAVMKVVNPKVAGRADGGRVAAEVKRQLAS